MKALINPDYGHQVQDVQPEEFPVVPPLYFVECPESVVAYGFNYNPDTGEFVDVRPPVIPLTSTQITDAPSDGGPSVIA